MDVDTPSGLLPSEIPAAALVERAIAHCARLRVEPEGSTVECLRSGAPEVHSAFRYALAKELAQYLGSLGACFRELYAYGSSMRDGAFPCSDIDILVVVERRRDEVVRLLLRIDLALAACFRNLVRGGHVPVSLLDVHIADVDEARERRGYGALLTGVGTCPVCLWRAASEAEAGVSANAR